MGKRTKNYQKRMFPFGVSQPLVTLRKMRSLKRERLLWRSFISISLFGFLVSLISFLLMFDVEIIDQTKLGYVALITMLPLILLTLVFLLRSSFGLGCIDRGLRLIPLEGDHSVDWLMANAKEGTTAFFYVRDVLKLRPGCLTRYEFSMLLKYIERDSI